MGSRLGHVRMQRPAFGYFLDMTFGTYVLDRRVLPRLSSNNLYSLVETSVSSSTLLEASTAIMR